MLDFELAEIYGYETKNLNRQIKNNAEKFYGDDFKFQLTKEEFLEILRCKNFTSSWGGTRYLPNAFTEQGVYMLMTVLRGELATKQSRALVRAFKAMKDYISTKTLHLLQDIRKGVRVTIFSDNIYNKLSASDYSDYQRQFPGRTIIFKHTMNKAHDRFIVLNYGTKNERIFHCGLSSKDAGKKLAAITEFSEGDVMKAMHDVITNMLGNLDLVLK